MDPGQEIRGGVAMENTIATVISRIPDLNLSGSEDDQLARMRVGMLRKTFLPMITYLVDKNLIPPLANGKITLQEIIKLMINQPDLQQDQIVEQLKEKYLPKGGHYTPLIDWSSEVDDLVMEGGNHPLMQLSQETTQKLPPNLQQVLTKLSLD